MSARIWVLLLVLVFWQAKSHAATTVIDHIVGGGSSTTDGAAGTDTDAGTLSGLAVDANGDVYYSDAGFLHYVVRKWDHSTGLVSTFAGTFGQYGNPSDGDGNVATDPSVSLGEPAGLVFGTVGGVKYLFIACHNHCVIRAVNMTTNVITTVAGTTFGFAGDGDTGNAAVTGKLNDPYGLTFDAANTTLYFADRINQRIRSLDLSGGIGAGTLDTVAGNGQAGFAGDGDTGNAASNGNLNNPYGVDFDGTNTLYIADTFNSRIRTLDLVTSTLSTFSGDGVVGFFGNGSVPGIQNYNLPYDVKVDSVSGNVYIADSTNDVVRYYDAGGTGTIENFAGGGFSIGINGNGAAPTNAYLFHPVAVAVDAAHNAVYISDQFHSQIRRVAPSVAPTITTAPLSYTIVEGQFFSLTNTASGTETVSFSYTGLPSWLTTSDPQFQPALQTIVSGTPGAADVAVPVSITINATNQVTQAAPSKTLMITVNPAPPSLTTASTATGTVGATFNFPLTATGTQAGLTYSLASGTLPPGLNIAGNAITGTPLPGAVGTTNVVLQANNASPTPSTKPLAITINAVPPGLTNSAVATGKAGLAFTYTLTANGTPPFTFSTTALPPGLSLAGATIGGTPTTPGDTVVTVTATNAGGSSNSTLIISITVPAINVVIDTTKNPAKTNDPITFTATTDAPTGTFLNYLWNFGDGSTADGNPITHAYTTEGEYRVSCTVLGFSSQSYAEILFTALAPNIGAEGVKNISDGAQSVTNPDDGLSVSVTASDGGVIELSIASSRSGAGRAESDFATVFGDIPGRSSAVIGSHPVHKYTQPGEFIADVVIVDPVTNKPRGHVRKTLSISRAETGQAPLISAPPASRSLTLSSMKGKFVFNKNTPDQVAFSGLFQLPAGFDASGQELTIAMGNIVDVVSIDAKGRALTGGQFGRIKKLQVTYPRPTKPKPAKKGQPPAPTPVPVAKIDFQLVSPDLNATGFDTEGITTAAGNGVTVDRSIQVAFLFAGVSYETFAPVKFTVDKSGDTGSIAGRSSTK